MTELFSQQNKTSGKKIRKTEISQDMEKHEHFSFPESILTVFSRVQEKPVQEKRNVHQKRVKIKEIYYFLLSWDLTGKNWVVRVPFSQIWSVSRWWNWSKNSEKWPFSGPLNPQIWSVSRWWNWSKHRENTQYLNISVKTPSGKSVVTLPLLSVYFLEKWLHTDNRQQTRVRAGPLTQRT